jgi:hypothetical protein
MYHIYMSNFLFPYQTGSDGRTIPDNTIVVQADMPFTGLYKIWWSISIKVRMLHMPHLVSFNCVVVTCRGKKYKLILKN